MLHLYGDMMLQAQIAFMMKNKREMHSVLRKHNDNISHTVSQSIIKFILILINSHGRFYQAPLS